MISAGRISLPAFYFVLGLSCSFPDMSSPPFSHYNSAMDNKTLARILRETAQLLEIDGAIIGRYRTYEKAAELIAGMHESIEQLAKEPGKLEELPGIGDRMVEHIEEILKTGDYSLRQKLLKKFPVTLLDILNLQSLGPKKVAFLWSNFKAATVADVRNALEPLLERAREAATAAALAEFENRVGAGSRAARGLEDTLAAVNERRVETLLLARNFAARGVRCPQCGLLYPEGTTTCPTDGSQTAEIADLRETVVQAAVLQDASVLVFGEGSDPAPAALQRGGGIAALLRF